MPNDTKKKAAPGWYADERWPSEERRWDGAQWLDEWRPERGRLGPGAYMLIGLALASLLGMLSAILVSLNQTLGWWALGISAAVAGTVFQIGLIGKAVEVGTRSARLDGPRR